VALRALRWNITKALGIFNAAFRSGAHPAEELRLRWGLKG